LPKLFGRQIHPMLMGAIGLIGAYAFYTVLFPGDAPATTARKAKVVAKKTVGEADYLLSDYTYKVDPLPDGVTPKDAFKPLVVKSTGGGPNGISIDNFTYSGMATINGEADGLLENSQTGQGDFVKQGDKWHDTWLVVSLSADQIQLKNDGGDITTLQAGAASAKAAASSAAGPAVNNTPVNIVGAIGGPDLTVQPDPTQMGRQGGGGRRGRRNRGGGGGGGVGAATPDGG
jgi:hypothetical protein